MPDSKLRLRGNLRYFSIFLQLRKTDVQSTTDISASLPQAEEIA